MDFSKWTLDDYRSWLDICINCGACVAHGPVCPHNNQTLPPYEWSGPDKRCPSLEYYNFSSHAAKGRLLNAGAVWRDGIEITDDMINLMYTCASCGVCNEICYMWKPMYIIQAMRQEIVEQKKELPEPLPELFANMDEKHNLFGLDERAKNLPNLPTKGKDLYFTGCYTSYLLPKIARVNARILMAGGLDLCHMGSDEHCCGEVAYQGGNMELFREMAKRNVDKVIEAGSERVICSCAHCYKTWKEAYPNALQMDLPFKVCHVTEVLAELLAEGKLQPIKPVNKTVTFHDPCFLRSTANEAPRAVLAAIPGLELKEMPRHGKWSYCCGGGAKIVLNCYPDFASDTGSERLAEAKETADEVITSCPVCFNQLRHTAQTDSVDIGIEDISVLLAESLGISTEM
ncbi:MAG: (Fe-S)-binding protein [Clostridiales bacterium]|jgi:heterodisulfide reductase subunit D|nr:(Fe-S)-binding protein [Clostridiales bacterium]